MTPLQPTSRTAKAHTYKKKRRKDIIAPSYETRQQKFDTKTAAYTPENTAFFSGGMQSLKGDRWTWCNFCGVCTFYAFFTKKVFCECRKRTTELRRVRGWDVTTRNCPCSLGRGTECPHSPRLGCPGSMLYLWLIFLMISSCSWWKSDSLHLWRDNMLLAARLNFEKTLLLKCQDGTHIETHVEL